MKIVVTEWKKIEEEWFKKDKIFDGKEALKNFEDYLEARSISAGEKTSKVQVVFFVGGIQK